MKIHAIQTGTLTMKTRQRVGVGRGGRRLLNIFRDPAWTDPLPIYAFAIEHPEGVIVVDTGETVRATQSGYFPAWHPYFKLCLRRAVTPEQEIGPQLRQLGIEPRDARWVVLTHMHADHVGGLRHFPGVEVVVSRTELAASRGLRGRVRGYVDDHLPGWFDPTVVDLPEAPFGPFPRSRPLTAAGDVTLVALPGHAPGQMGVVVERGDQRVLIGGDSSYRQDLMLSGQLDGVSPDPAAARQTIDRIQAFVAEAPTVYVVAHDPDSARRLEEHRPV